MNWIQSRLEPESATAENYEKWGPRFRAKTVGQLAGVVGRFSEGPLESLAGPAASTLKSLSKGLEIQARITDQFVPFMATHNYRFSCGNTRAAYSRLAADDQLLLDWSPEKIDWRHYLLEVHGPGIQQNVSPLIDEKIRKERKALRAHDDLVAMIDNAAEHHDLAPALQRTHEDGFTTVSYRMLRLRSIATAARLQSMGLEAGARVCSAGPIIQTGPLRTSASSVRGWLRYRSTWTRAGTGRDHPGIV